MTKLVPPPKTNRAVAGAVCSESQQLLQSNDSGKYSGEQALQRLAAHMLLDAATQAEDGDLTGALYSAEWAVLRLRQLLLRLGVAEIGRAHV